jgi:valyl-tRNA synthetase
LPFVTEEAWSWEPSWSQESSIHLAPWPSPGNGDPALLALASEAIGAVRRAKSAARVSMKAPVASLVMTGDDPSWQLLSRAAGDLRAAGVIDSLTHRPGSALAFEVTL